MKPELIQTVLGALLHDIGKFSQRAGDERSGQLEGEYLPSFNNRPTHWHAVYTDYFIENRLPLPAELEEKRARLARIAAAHHKPDEADLAEMCVCIADRLSAGSDRIDIMYQENQVGFRNSRLVSIFDEVELAEHNFVQPGGYYYDLVPLKPDHETDSVMPLKGEPRGPEDDYKHLYDRFLNDLGKVARDYGINNYFDSLAGLLEKYTWCVPSSAYKTVADVSLYDHAFSTAAIAQALYRYHEARGDLPAWNDPEAKFILVGGDVSGIQSYIFDIQHANRKGVAKIFRARSFLLQAYVKSVILMIQHRLGLLSCCRIVDAGGKFVLLLDNSDEVRQILEETRDELEKWCRRKFKGLLSISLCWDTTLSQQDFRLEAFQKAFGNLNSALEKAKLQKLASTFESLGNFVDDDYEEFENGNCALCGKNAASRQSDPDEDLRICNQCFEHVNRVGTALPRATHIVYGMKGEIELFQTIRLRFLKNNEPMPPKGDDLLKVETLVDGQVAFAKARLAMHIPEVKTEELKDESWFEAFSRHKEFKPLSSEMKSGQFVPKTFELIADKSLKPGPDGKLVGRPLLALLKADVDNLGLAFSIGLRDKLSLARMASMSRMLNFFFSDYLVNLLKDKYDDVYTVFAGGDDVFLIGPWNQVVELASVLREKFEKFSARNPDLTISAGIRIVKPRLPVGKAARLAEEDLEKAKSAKKPVLPLKDKVCLLDKVITWEELDKAFKLGEKFDDYLEKKENTGFTHGLAYRLLEYQRMYRRFMDGRDLKSGRYVSLAHYDIGRNLDPEDENGRDCRATLMRIFAVGDSDHSELNNMDIALFYALNRNRSIQ